MFLFSGRRVSGFSIRTWSSFANHLSSCEIKPFDSPVIVGAYVNQLLAVAGEDYVVNKISCLDGFQPLPAPRVKKQNRFVLSQCQDFSIRREQGSGEVGKITIKKRSPARLTTCGVPEADCQLWLRAIAAGG